MILTSSREAPASAGYAEIAGEYLWALREAKMIAAAHFGKKEVESAPRLKEPRQEGRKRTMSTKEQGLADTIMAMQEPERLRAEIERLRALLSACKVAMELSNENGGRTDWRHMIAGINSILQ